MVTGRCGTLLCVLTRLELLRAVPIVRDILDGVMWHPQDCASWHIKLAAQRDVMAVADTQLPNPHWWVHSQALLQIISNAQRTL